MSGKSGSVSPTQKALKKLRADGWPLVEITERWNPFAKIRQDLFGVIDVLAAGPEGLFGVQATSHHNVLERVKKIRGHDNLPHILAAGIRFEVWGFTKGTTAPTRVEVIS